MKLETLNNPTIANAGAALCVTSLGVVGKAVVDLYNGAHPPMVAIAFAFAGIALGVVLAYLGMPSSVASAFGTPAETVAPPAAAQQPASASPDAAKEPTK